MACGVAVKMTRIAQVARSSTAGHLVSLFSFAKKTILYSENVGPISTNTL